MRSILMNLELWLSALGLLVIGIVPLLLGGTADVHWVAVALTAMIVGLLHGIIFWVVRRRQRRVRQATIALMRGMLQDRINNRLTRVALQLSITMPDDAAELGAVQVALHDIASLLDHLSEETLQTWQATYAAALHSPTELAQSR